MLYEKLPLSSVKFDLQNLTVEKAFKELNKIVSYPENDLWDGGFYFIKKKHENFYSEATLYIFSEALSKERFDEALAIECKVAINSDIIELFQFIQRYFQNINPQVPFDSIFITVQNDGRYIVNYEFNDDEVSPDAPPPPPQMTAAYLCENLQNCLAYNAPENYKWLWEIIERKRTEEGRIQIGGNFYYSISEDKSQPQILEPGEHIYMYNVSEKLFDEFLQERTKDWSKIQLEFSREGKVSCSVLETGFEKKEDTLPT